MSEHAAIDLSGELTERLSPAGAPGRVMVLSYVDADGQPHVSIRGSIHAHSQDQLAMWVRDGYVGTMTASNTPAEGGLLKAIGNNEKVAVIYREGLSTYVFSGRARVEDDESERDIIFKSMPEGEQGHSTSPSGERSGTAIVIEVDHVVGGTLGQGGVILSHVEMARN